MADPRDTQSEWQKSIEGQWYGLPSVFEPDGTQVGHIKVNRASTSDGGRTTYTMDTALDVRGPLRPRFEAKDFSFGLVDGDEDRVYLGPDFMGAGQPYGRLDDAHYYSPAWQADLRTMVHVLEDGATQVYSSLLFDGPTIVGVFNGLYEVAHDYDTNPSTQARIDAFVQRERQAGQRPHVLPFKRSGRWIGEVEVHGPDQSRLGSSRVEIAYRPITLLRSEMTVRMEGAVNQRYRFERSRQGNRHTFEGPDLFGNAIGYGRALYTSQHFFGEAKSIRGREFLIDDDYSLSVAWKVCRSERVEHVLYGLLKWEPGEVVLSANHDARSGARGAR